MTAREASAILDAARFAFEVGLRQCPDTPPFTDAQIDALFIASAMRHFGVTQEALQPMIAEIDSCFEAHPEVKRGN